MTARPSARTPEQLRPVTLETGVNRYAEGSCLVSFGNTKVLVTATVEESLSRRAFCPLRDICTAAPRNCGATEVLP